MFFEIPFVTIALIIVNAFVFLHQISQIAQTDTQQAAIQAEVDFYEQWGLIPTELAEFQVVGLITYMFVHGGAFHLIGNMVMLYVFGPAIEFGLGRWTMLVFYGVFGVMGGLAHAFLDLGSSLPLVGASGAIAGLIGAYTVIYGLGSKIRMMGMVLLHFFFFYVPAALFGVVFILIQISHTSDDLEGGGVAWWCHIGGFVAGAIVAAICKKDMEWELVGGSTDTVRMMSAEEIAKEQALEEELKERKAAGLSSIVVPLSESELAPPPTACEYCNAELKEENQVGEQLFRCSGCQRMVYLSVQQAEAMALAKS